MSSTAEQPRVSVIVVSFNTREMTLECLRSLFAKTEASLEVIAIDNASGDGSADAIAGEFPVVKLLAETENHGFARANNIAARHARGEYLLLLNPDTVVLDGAIDRLLDFAGRRPHAGIWGGRTLYGDHSLNPTCCWRRMSLWNVFCRTAGLTGLLRRSALFNSETYGGWNRDTERAVDIVSGCFFLIRRDLWEQLGGFELAYVMYGEEADLCLRARTLGASPLFTPDATIIHYGGASEAVRSEKMIRLLRAKMTLIRRHFATGLRGPAGLLFSLWPFSRWIVLSLLSAATGGRRGTESAATWAEIWRRRSEWRHGYPEAEGD